MLLALVDVVVRYGGTLVADCELRAGTVVTVTLTVVIAMVVMVP